MRLALVTSMRADEGQIPIGLLTLAAVTRDEGIAQPRVFDLPAPGGEDAFIRDLCEFDVVGFSSICSTYPRTIHLCGRLKAARPDVLVVLGGPQASLTAASSLARFPFVDLIFVGEAEIGWRAFVRGTERRAIPGLAWRDGGEIRENESAPLVRDLATLPLPAFELYDSAGREGVTPIEIGRGCPFACSFCAASPFFKRCFRLKPVPRILMEMDRLCELTGTRTFYLVQDSFTNRRQFVEEMCRELQARSYVWYCSARTDQVSRELLARMAEAGCRGVYFGLETGSPRMQELISKRLDVPRSLAAIDEAAAAGLQVTTSLIIGFPDEEPADLRATIEVYLDLKARRHAAVQLHVLAPLPGSALMARGLPLAWDGMPSDFSEAGAAVDAAERALVERHPDIFSSFWHFVNPSIPRARFLYLSRLLTAASIALPNTLCLAARHLREPLVAHLLDGEMAPRFHADAELTARAEDWIAATAEVLRAWLDRTPHDRALDDAWAWDLAWSRAELAGAGWTLVELPAAVGDRPRRSIVEGLDVPDGGPRATYLVQKPEVHVQAIRLEPSMARSLEQLCSGETARAASAGPGPSLEAVLDAACGPCGACCFDEGGILCGRDEWPAIREALPQVAAAPEPAPLAGGELVASEARRLLVEAGERKLVFDRRAEAEAACAAAGAAEIRRVCPALDRDEARWRCSIEAVKPAGCIAFPLKLVLRDGVAGAPPCLSLEFEGAAGATACALARALTASPPLLERYRQAVQARLERRAGAFALAAYNRAGPHRAAAAADDR